VANAATAGKRVERRRPKCWDRPPTWCASLSTSRCRPPRAGRMRPTTGVTGAAGAPDLASLDEPTLPVRW